ncbi:gamma-glutamylcyclotransferase [Streptomyces sp. TRM66268-LWL]|uniref:Gamma-glutamylcyclotransferase n=1 Tax=Streptomyces polyasparticus TaxID=2767826 RepID=A0ABR7SMK6_9ACTN|nr:gamma-glutamylcyclotransferase family protein [Streptomyces polyasparticus]MBC9716129.1 gamma-glutamylcyclotransferase [Streptomyces polyasparticus]
MRPDGGVLPFFVYGTLRPGEYNHRRFLAGRTVAAEPARWVGADLYEGPGYPYAVEGAGTVHGEVVRPAPGEYAQLLALLDRLEDYVPGDPHNDYERIARTVETATGPVDAWVYVAAPAVAARLRAGGRVLPGGDWLTRAGS